MKKQPRWKRKPLNRRKTRKYFVGVDMARPGSGDYSSRVWGTINGRSAEVTRVEISSDGVDWKEIPLIKDREFAFNLNLRYAVAYPSVASYMSPMVT